MIKKKSPEKYLEAYEQLGSYKLVSKKFGVTVETVRRNCRTAKAADKPIVDDDVVSTSKVLEQIGARYTDKELAILARGAKKSSECGTVNLFPQKSSFRLGLISDTHCGSKYSDSALINAARDDFKKKKVDYIMHTGDVVEGMSNKRLSSHVQELTHIGFEEQMQNAVEIFSSWDFAPMYVVSGNHDDWFKEQSGADMVKTICRNVDSMNFLGHGEGNVVIDGIDICLFHGLDGSSYAHSYSVQKIIESLTGGKKPDILLRGHIHKYFSMFDRHIHAVSVPSIEMQTPWMKLKRLKAHCGWCIADVGISDEGVSSFKIEYVPAYV